MHTRRRDLIAVALLAGLAPMGWAKDTPDKLLLGKWKHVSLNRKVDGQPLPPQASDGKSFAEFGRDGTWTLRTPTNVAGGTYKWLDAQRIEQTILESGLAIQIGMVSVKSIRVTESRLEIITVQTAAEMDKFMPPAKPGTRRPNEVVITSVFFRAVQE